MIKGIVNCVEKDITRIPMKGKNLFDWNWLVDGYHLSQQTGLPDINVRRTSILQPIDVSSIGRLYISYDTIGNPNIRAMYSILDSNDTLIRRVTQIGSGGLIDASGGSKLYVAFYDNITSANTVTKNNVSNIMLNSGSTPLPYEPYGYQEGWEVRKGDGTLIWARNDTISVDSGTLPIKGYGVPLVSITPEGNSEQKSVNLADPSATVAGYQNSDGSIHTPGSGNERTTDYIPFTKRLYYIIDASASGNINWCFYDENKTAIYFYGGNFSPPASGYIDPTSSARYIRISWTNAANQPICVTTEQQSSFVPYNPIPTSPIDVTGCGDRTGNLWNEDYTGISATLKYVPVYVGNADVTMSTTCKRTSSGAVLFLLSGNVSSGAATNTSGVWATSGSYAETSRTASPIDGYVTVAFRTMTESGREYTPVNANSMLNSGSQAIPYEPYGYKVALTANSTTTPIYLGQTPTVRKVNKLVLTGEENWSKSTSADNTYLVSYTYLGIDAPYEKSISYCTHAVIETLLRNIDNGEYILGQSSLYFRIDSISTKDDFKSYLQQQYAAGTPVTIWYILSEPTTSIVNEPLMKIGTYADTLTVTDQDVTITPAVGNDTITVDTTLPPSKFTVVGHVRERST